MAYSFKNKLEVFFNGKNLEDRKLDNTLLKTVSYKKKKGILKLFI